MKKEKCEHKQTYTRRKDGIPVFLVCSECLAELPIKSKSSKKLKISKQETNDEEVN